RAGWGEACPAISWRPCASRLSPQGEDHRHHVGHEPQRHDAGKGAHFAGGQGTHGTWMRRTEGSGRNGEKDGELREERQPQPHGAAVPMRSYMPSFALGSSMAPLCRRTTI